MSIHCLICGSQGHWIPKEDYEDTPRECKEDENTWTRMVLFHDNLVPAFKIRKRPIEEWWVHTLCLKRFIEERTEAETKLKDTVKWL